MSPKTTSTSSLAFASAWRAASTACAVPRRSLCSNTSTVGNAARAAAGDILPPRPHDDRDAIGAGGAGGPHHMSDHRQSRDRGERLGKRRAHALALARGEHDGEAAPARLQAGRRPLAPPCARLLRLQSDRHEPFSVSSPTLGREPAIPRRGAPKSASLPSRPASLLFHLRRRPIKAWRRREPRRATFCTAFPPMSWPTSAPSVSAIRHASVTQRRRAKARLAVTSTAMTANC